MSEHQPTVPEGQKEHETNPEHPSRIYVASLSDYNAGRLHGAWLDAAQSAEELLASISEMLAASPEPIAEEWAIHDYEGFGPLRLSEYEDIQRVSEIALGIAEHGPAFAAWATHLERSQWDDLPRFEDAYMGQWDSLDEYAENLLDSFGIWQAIERVVPEFLQPYIRVDSEAFARDLSSSGDVDALEVGSPGEGVYIFEN